MFGAPWKGVLPYGPACGAVSPRVRTLAVADLRVSLSCRLTDGALEAAVETCVR